MHTRTLILVVLIRGVLPAAAENLQGRVVVVSDGDTITVIDRANQQHKIRLAAIDAPERGQAFGNRSKEHLSNLVIGKPVSVDYNKRDRYGRIVGKAIVGSPSVCPEVREDCPKTLDAGLAQITVGLAWHYKKYAAEQTPEDRKMYALAEKEARAKHAGLWHDSAPIPPWEFRKIRKDRGR